MNFRSNLERIAEIYGGIAIFSVDQGSSTHRAGVRAGDVLVAVNGRRVRRMAEYATARTLRRELLELVVVRGGRTITLWAGIHAKAVRAAANDNDGNGPALGAAPPDARFARQRARGLSRRFVASTSPRPMKPGSSKQSPQRVLQTLGRSEPPLSGSHSLRGDLRWLGSSVAPRRPSCRWC